MEVLLKLDRPIEQILKKCLTPLLRFAARRNNMAAARATLFAGFYAAFMLILSGAAVRNMLLAAQGVIGCVLVFQFARHMAPQFQYMEQYVFHSGKKDHPLSQKDWRTYRAIRSVAFLLGLLALPGALEQPVNVLVALTFLLPGASLYFASDFRQPRRAPKQKAV